MKTIGNISILVLVLGHCAAARATPLGGRARLGLETRALSYESLTLKAPSGGPEISTSRAHLGVAASGAGLGAGVGVGESFLMGGRLLLSHTSSDTEGGGSASETGFELAATPEFLFEGSDVRPFLGLEVGYGTASAGSAGTEISSGTFFVGPSVGLRGFVSEAFSIDPRVSLLYETGSTTAAGVDLSHGGFALTLGVAFSGWFGEGVREPDAPAPTHDTAGEDEPEDGESEASGAPSQIRPSPVPGPLRSERRLAVLLGDGSRLILQPSERAGQVDATFVVPNETEELARCPSLRIEGRKKDVVFEPRTVEFLTSGTEDALALGTTVSLAALRRLARGREDAPIEGCGVAWYLTARDRRAIGDFARDVAETARSREPLVGGSAAGFAAIR